MKTGKPHILLVNPWIHDFAAYDVWAKPMGLLTLGALLRRCGLPVSYVDCLDRFHPRAPKTDPFARHGRGPYHKQPIPLPEGLSDNDRVFRRYGIEPEWFREDLGSLSKPDLILVTSIMTYWAPGVRETIGILKAVFPDVPVILGGIYASLAAEHAQRASGADEVVTGHGEEKLFGLVEKYTGFAAAPDFDPNDLDSLPYPAYDLQRVINYVPLQTSRGCPFSCAYCASNHLDPKRMIRSPEAVVREIKYWREQYGVRDFVFYDDALLINPEKHAHRIFRGVVNAGLDLFFHTPNALHVRELTRETTDLMFRAGFKHVRLGLETTEFDKRDGMDDKVSNNQFARAAANLLASGFKREQVGAYLLFGLPGQSYESVEFSVKTVLENGISPVLTHYTPIPHTPMWEQGVKSSRYDLAEDPLYTNNSIFPCSDKAFTWDALSRLKKLIASRNRS